MKLLALSLSVALVGIANAANELRTVNGDTVVISDIGTVHLVFIDIWASYGGHGPEAAVKALPDTFLDSVPTVWIQPRLNVTDAQVLKYQSVFPNSKPLVIDDYLRLMRQSGVRTTPAHVLLKNGAVAFHGDTPALLAHIGAPPAKKSPETMDEPGVEQQSVPPGIPSVEDVADLSKVFFASGDTVHLIFLEDLCPMPHFPQCEETVQALSQSYDAGKDNWVVIYNSFYSDAHSVYRFAEKHNLKMPALFDQKRTLYERYQVHSTPYLIQVDRNGKVLYRGDEFSTITIPERGGE